MAKKLLCVVVLLLALMCVLASCNDNTTNTPSTHTHTFGEWKIVKEAACNTIGSRERYCSCGEKEIDDIIGRGYHEFTWEVTTEATCTTDGLKTATCNYCSEKKTEVIAAGHNYEKGICTNCNRGKINIILPETPITVHDCSYSSSNIKATIKITSLEISEIIEYGNLEEYSIKFIWAGEKIYDCEGANHSSSGSFTYKIYDSEGFLIYSGWGFSPDVVVGEKFKNVEFNVLPEKFDPNETYTLEILNRD